MIKRKTIDPNRSFARQLLLWLLVVIVTVPYLFVALYNAPDTKVSSQAEGSDKPDKIEINTPKTGPALWSKKFDGNIAKNVYSVSKTSNGYLLSGDTSRRNVFVMEIDKDGNQLWYRTLRNDFDYSKSISIEVEDGFFISYRTTVVKYSNPGVSVKLHKQTRRVLYHIPIYFTSMVPYKDGVIVGGENNTLFFIDKDGQIVWKKQVVDSTSKYITFQGSIKKIIKTKDGNFVGVGGFPTWLFKFDGMGNILWSTGIYDETRPFGTDDIIQTEDGGYLINGVDEGCPDQKNPKSRNAKLVKLDQNGNFEWQKCFCTQEDDAGLKIIDSSDGNYLMINRSMQTLWIVKVRPDGSAIWAEGYKNNTVTYSHDSLGSIIRSGNKLIMAGFSIENINPSQYLGWIMKTDLNGSTDKQLFEKVPLKSLSLNINLTSKEAE